MDEAIFEKELGEWKVTLTVREGGCALGCCNYIYYTVEAVRGGEVHTLVYVYTILPRASWTPTA